MTAVKVVWIIAATTTTGSYPEWCTDNINLNRHSNVQTSTCPLGVKC
jgi:hypothetical protein